MSADSSMELGLARGSQTGPDANKQLAGTLRASLRLYWWPITIAALLAMQAALVLALSSSSSIRQYRHATYFTDFVLLIVAAGLAARNAAGSRRAIRLFWTFVALGCATWALNAFGWIYYVVVLGKSRPDFLASSSPLFLHIIFMIAAVVSRPHLAFPGVRPYRTTLNFLVALFSLLFVYVFVLFPYEYDPLKTTRFAILYFGENVLLLVILAAVFLRTVAAWKSLYGHMLGASSLYALGSLYANLVTASGAGSVVLHNLPYAISAAWFAWLSLRGRALALELERSVRPGIADAKYSSTIAMLAVMAIPLAGIWELFRSEEIPDFRFTRLLITFLALLFLAVTAFVIEHFAKRELSSDVEIAHERLRMTMASGKFVGWDLDVNTGQDWWFGDLPTMLGIQADTYAGYLEDFYRSLHPDDREQVAQALERAREHRTPFQTEYRVIRQDGMIRWASARGEFHYGRTDKPERMLGMAVDITDRKVAEEALRKSEEKFSKAFRQSPLAITLISARDHRYLDVNEAFERHTGWNRAEVIGRTPMELDLWVDVQTRAEFMKRLQDDRAVQESEVRFRRKDGALRVGLGSAELIEIDHEQCILSVIADITERRRAEEALREVESRLLGEAKVLARLNQSGVHLWQTSSLDQGLKLILDIAMELVGADKGTVQLYDKEQGVLEIAAQYGFEQPFLDCFKRVSVNIPAASGRVLLHDQWVVIENVETDAGYAPFLSVAREAGYRAITSSLLVDTDGTPLGMLSLHFRNPHRPSEATLQLLDLHMDRAASFIRRCKTESALRESEEHASELVLRSPVAMLVTHGAEHRQVSLVNRKFTELFGYTIEEIPDEAHWWPLAYPDEAYRAEIQAEWRRRLEQAMATSGDIDPMEANVRCKDGSTRHIEFHFAMLGDNGVVSFVDLTDRHRAEMELRESEERFRRVVAHIGDAVVVIDAKGRVVFANDNFLHLFGLNREQLSSRILQDSVAAEFREVAWDRHNRRMRGEQVDTRFEFQGIRSDGFRIWLEADVVPVTDSDGQVIGSQAAIRDITTRKDAEQSLQESEQRFRLVANTAPVMIWMSGTDKLRYYFNQPWLEFTGRPFAAELGNGWVEGVHPDDLTACMTTHNASFNQRKHFRMQYRLRRYDGEYRWITDTGVPRFNPDGSFAGFIGSCIDITNHKLAEDALSNLGRKLMEAQEEERRYIARELHDDINQRLVLLSVDLERWRLGGSESAKDSHDHVRDVQQRVAEITKDIQALSHRLHSSKLEYLGVAAAARSFCKEFSDQHRVNVEFISDVPRSVPREVSLAIFRVLQEALQNGVKHGEAQQFRVELKQKQNDIHLTVTDAGKGFDPLDSVNSHGLGLISMRERMQLVNGFFAIESQPGRGTTVRARASLPVDAHLESAAS